MSFTLLLLLLLLLLVLVIIRWNVEVVNLVSWVRQINNSAPSLLSPFISSLSPRALLHFFHSSFSSPFLHQKLPSALTFRPLSSSLFFPRRHVISPLVFTVWSSFFPPLFPFLAPLLLVFTLKAKEVLLHLPLSLLQRQTAISSFLTSRLLRFASVSSSSGRRLEFSGTPSPPHHSQGGVLSPSPKVTPVGLCSADFPAEEEFPRRWMKLWYFL